MPASKTAKLSQLPTSGFAGSAAIYVHWPFCLKKCPYCDFNSHVRDTVSHENWRGALLQEIETMAGHFPNLQASSIFFGGGTPSLMEPETVAAVIESVRSHWKPADNIEITLEANPSSVEADRFRAYRTAGVNRLSVGIQSLKDDVLKFLGRLHSAKEALQALKVAQDNFERVTFDLIYARPEQTLTEWRTELNEALSFGTDHLSLYQLTIEEGTAFHHQFQRGKFTLPDEDKAADLFELTQELTEAAGKPAYETSNHAAPGQRSRHNLAYWQGDPYIGIGPGAHGRLPSDIHGEAFAHAQIKRPENWLDAVVSRGTGMETLERISAKDRAIEAILTGLRLKDGIDLNVWRRKFGQRFGDIVNLQTLNDVQEGGYINYTPNRLALTSSGMPLLNFILGKLVA